MKSTSKRLSLASVLAAEFFNFTKNTRKGQLQFKIGHEGST